MRRPETEKENLRLFIDAPCTELGYSIDCLDNLTSFLNINKTNIFIVFDFVLFSKSHYCSQMVGRCGPSVEPKIAHLGTGSVRLGYHQTR